ncbi:MAG: TolC family protein [Methylococcus sp.]|nr:TolC family protein [Methylococcus sp.]
MDRIITAIKSGIAASSLALACSTLFGCAEQNYKPAPLPIFMRESGAATSLPSPEVAPSATPLPPAATVPGGEQNVETVELSLDGAISRALEADPEIKAGYENLRQVEADLVTAGLLPNPELTSDLLMMPWGQPFRATKQGGPTQTDAIVAFPIDWLIFGKRAAAIVTAQKGLDVSTARFSDLLRQRISGTIAAYYNVLEAEALLELAQIDLKNLTQLEHVISKRVAYGDIPTMELDRVRLNVFAATRELRAQQAALASTQAKLRSFLGYAKRIPLKLQGSLDVAKPAAPLTAETAFSLAEENRPDLIALQHQIAMAAANVELEERRAYPMVRPAFGYTKQFQNEMDQPNAESWNVILQMNLPLFDRNQGNIAKARSQKTQAEHNLTMQLVNMSAEIVQAAENFRAAHDALILDDPGQTTAASNVRDKIRLAFEFDERPLIDVLDSQRTFRDTYKLHIASRSNYWHSLYALNSAIGKQVLR